MSLQKWQRNSIFEAIQAAGLNPSEFGLDDEDQDVRIGHRRSEAYFIIGQKSGSYVGRYVVGDGWPWPYEVYSWPSLMQRVSRWLEDVKRDIETPDLWAQLRGDTALLVGTSDEATENTPFTPEERQEIAEQLQRLSEELRRTCSLSNAQMQALDKRVDYLVEASGRLGRKDWRIIFLGVLFPYVLGATLPPEAATRTLATVLRAVGHLFGHGFPELPGG